MRWPSAWLVASSVVVLAGCGSGQATQTRQPAAPKIPAAVAQLLAADADAAASQSGCAGHDAATKLLQDITANISQIPARYQEPLTSAANDLVSKIPDCAEPRQDHRHKPHERHKKPPKKDEHDGDNQ
jgi:outer membrane murein-binding lipoprotein Lpp